MVLPTNYEPWLHPALTMPPWNDGLALRERRAASWLVGRGRRAQRDIPRHKVVPKQGLLFDLFTGL